MVSSEVHPSKTATLTSEGLPAADEAAADDTTDVRALESSDSSGGQAQSRLGEWHLSAEVLHVC